MYVCMCALAEGLLAVRSFMFIVGDILVLEISLSISDSYLPLAGRVGTQDFPPPSGGYSQMATAIPNTLSVTISGSLYE